MNEIVIGIIAITATIIIYSFILPIHKKVQSPLTLPIVAVSAIMILALLLLDIPYETYMIGGQWIEFLMGPAVVALALPLYRHYDMLRKYMKPIFAGVTIGAFVGVTTGLFMAKALGFERELILALLPKSVTTPVAISIGETLEGPLSLTAVFVVIAGVSGAIISPVIFKLFKLERPIGRGIGMGSASHAIGTATSMDRDALEGSISSIAMILSAIIVSILAPLCALLFL
ncbi:MULTISPECIES: LrgB family protein [unclassified Oceanobacillus]|uniref:LrgB family protein n=1 Tax=unclassified Oceanobacillus TaxID=2630292 RepID=UPI00300DD2CC